MRRAGEQADGDGGGEVGGVVVMVLGGGSRRLALRQGAAVQRHGGVRHVDLRLCARAFARGAPSAPANRHGSEHSEHARAFGIASEHSADRGGPSRAAAAAVKLVTARVTGPGSQRDGGSHVLTRIAR